MWTKRFSHRPFSRSSHENKNLTYKHTLQDTKIQSNIWCFACHFCFSSQQVDQKTGGALSACGVAMELQAYSIKQCLMGITCATTGCTTGSRSCSWWRCLVDLARRYKSTELLDDGALLDCYPSTTEYDSELSVVQTPTPKRSRRNIFMTPTPRSQPQHQQESDSDEELADEQKQVAEQSGAKYVYWWDESKGGVRLSQDGTEEECSSVHPSSSGFVFCKFADDSLWESEVPNLVIQGIGSGSVAHKEALADVDMEEAEEADSEDAAEEEEEEPETAAVPARKAIFLRPAAAPARKAIFLRPAAAHAPKSNRRKLEYSKAYHKCMSALKASKLDVPARKVRAQKAAAAACVALGL